MTINRVNRVILVDFLETAFLASRRETRDLRDSRAEPTLQQTPKGGVMTRRETTAAPITTEPGCPACGGPPASSADHDDRTCPLTRTPGVVQRGRFAPRRKRPDFVDVPLDEGDVWDTGGRLFSVDGWPDP